ncbi:DUF3024 domain-containing protein [Ancylomarina sp.]|uniref:DUF3024 domain-containing protein n=1 Tax=Ancylomarina sp. TaxID=1970196 RepID=UPI00356B143F
MSILNINEKRVSDYIQTKRPLVELREQIDLGYSFKNNEVILFQIRPQWDDHSKKVECPYARCKYVKSQQVWKVYWMRATGTWKLYEPDPIVSNVESFIRIIESDEHSCFWG